MRVDDIKSEFTPEEWEANRENREKRWTEEKKKQQERDRKCDREQSERRKRREIHRYGHEFIYYHEYLKSKKWQSKKDQVMARCQGICEACEKEPTTQTHHITYQNLGNENLWELLGVCEKCHEIIHNIRKKII